MDATQNPFAPGAGSDPPELAGRDSIISAAMTALRRTKERRHAQGQLFLGLRGVGKTVLLHRIAELAEKEGYEIVRLEASEDRPLPQLVVPKLRQALLRLSTVERAKEIASRGLGALRAFASAFKVSYNDVELSVSAPGTADSGDLESDLTDLFLIVAEAARAAQKPVALFIDELQYVTQKDLSALIAATHRVTQDGLPLIVFAAGLPKLAELAGEAKSYAERLFIYPPIGALDAAASNKAIQEPIRLGGAEIEPSALALIYERTRGYPYFLQVWGSNSWNVAVKTPITRKDVQNASELALDSLDTGFFRVRLERVTPREKDYMRAMAELGPGPYKSSEVASRLGLKVTAAAGLRDALIQKGMVYGPAHGNIAFTVPMFDDFMRRTISDWKPKPKRKKARSG